MIDVIGIDSIAEDVIRVWGQDAQVSVMIEECAELTVALHHYARGKCGIGEVVSEIADVIIVAHQIAHTIAPPGAVQAAVDGKIKRLRLTIDKGDESKWAVTRSS